MKFRLTLATAILGTALVSCTSNQAALPDNETSTTGGTTTTSTGGTTTTTSTGGTTTTSTGGTSGTTTASTGGTTTTTTTSTDGTTSTGGATTTGGTSGGTVTAPTATAKSYNDLGNTPLNVTAADGLLAGDSGDTVTVTSPSAQGGTVAVNADGSFTYTPPNDFSGTDTFTYTLTNSAGSSSATVTITISAVGFYVNNTAAAGGNGSLAAPYNTLAQAVAAVGTQNAQIIVFQGDGTSNGLNTSVPLQANQSLVGASATAQPTLTGPITFSSNNTLQNVQIMGPNGVAINCTGASNGTIQGVTIANDTGTTTATNFNPAVNLNNATGVFTISNCMASNLADSVFFSQSSTGNLTWSVSNCTFTNVTSEEVAAGYELTGTAAQNITVSGCTFTNSAFAVAAEANTTNTAVALTMQNNVVQGGGTAFRGLDSTIEGSTSFVAIITNNTITNTNFEGIAIGVDGGLSKLALENNTVTGSGANATTDVSLVNQLGGVIDALLNGNTAGSYILSQNDNGAFNVEQFNLFSSQNVGTLTTQGNITNAPAGSLDIP
jgi:hypothetical protein